MKDKKDFVLPNKEAVKNFKMPPTPTRIKQFPNITFTDENISPYAEEMAKIKILLKKALKSNHFRQTQEVSELLNLAIHSVNSILDSSD